MTNSEQRLAFKNEGVRSLFMPRRFVYSIPCMHPNVQFRLFPGCYLKILDQI